MPNNNEKNRKPKSSWVRKRRNAASHRGELNFQRLEPKQLLAAVTVNNSTDLVNANVSSISSLIANDGGDGISLREAVEASNNTVGLDTITFDPLLFGGYFNDGLIRLTQGELSINEELTIAGPTLFDLVITGDADGDDTLLEGNITDAVQSSQGGGAFGGELADNSRVLNFSNATGTLTVSNLTITGGRTDFDGGGIYSNSGNISLTDTRVSGNIGTGSFGYVEGSNMPAVYSSSGGGISTISGNVTLTNSTVSDNYAVDTFILATYTAFSTRSTGGGIYTRSGDIVLTDSTISNNMARAIDNFAAGGGISNLTGSVSLTNSTVSGNNASGYRGSSGGGINAISGNITLTNSTVSSNSVETIPGLNNQTIDSATARGGGISFDNSTVVIVNSTITSNSASDSGGGIGLFTDDANDNQRLTLRNSVVAGNNTDDGIAADVQTVGDVLNDLIVENSLIGNTNGSGITAAIGSGNILNQAALLGPLADNGGPTQTHTLLEGSPAIDAGSNALAVGLETDQRGDIRVRSGTVDIGAIETEGPVVGDLNSDGVVNFLDISPFISTLSDGDFLDEADINRDGTVDFLDISPFITLLSSNSSAQSSPATGKSVASANPSGSVNPSKSAADVNKPQISSTVTRVSDPNLVTTAGSAVELPPTREASDAKNIATEIDPARQTVAAGVRPIDTYVGPTEISPETYSFLGDTSSRLRGAESTRPLVVRRKLGGSAVRRDISLESIEQYPSTEKSVLTAADLFDEENLR